MFIVDDIYDAFDLLEEKKEELFNEISKNKEIRLLGDFEEDIVSIFGNNISIDQSIYRVSKSKREGSILELICLLARDKEEYHYALFIELKVPGYIEYDKYDSLNSLVKEKLDDKSLSRLNVKLLDAYCEELTLDELE